MPRKRKNARNLNIMLKTKDMEMLEDFCEKTGLTKTATVEKAIEFYVRNTETIADVIRNNEKN